MVTQIHEGGITLAKPPYASGVRTWMPASEIMPIFPPSANDWGTIIKNAADEVGGSITISLDVNFGRPRIRNTRVPVYAILDALADGLDAQEVATQFPGISVHDVQDALRFAAIVCERGFGE